MPRTLTTRAESERLKAVAGWLRLLTVVIYRDRFGPSPVSLALYFSDATRYLPVFGGGTREYLPLVLEWGTIGDSLAASNVDHAPGNLSIRLSDVVPISAGLWNVARFSALLREGTNSSGYDKSEGDVLFSWLPPGGLVHSAPTLADGDEITWYTGRVDTLDPVE